MFNNINIKSTPKTNFDGENYFFSSFAFPFSNVYYTFNLQKKSEKESPCTISLTLRNPRKARWTNLRCRIFVIFFQEFLTRKKMSSHVIRSFEIPQQYTKYQLVYLYTLNMCIHALKDELWVRDTSFTPGPRPTAALTK